MTSKRSVGSTFPLAKPVMSTTSSTEAVMAAAALARFPPNPRVELLPSQSSQLAGVSVELKLSRSAMITTIIIVIMVIIPNAHASQG